jgi:hypothetical protein
MHRKDAIAWVVSVCAVTLRLSQAKTLGILVASAMRVERISLTNIGRNMVGSAKHQIKRSPSEGFCLNVLGKNVDQVVESFFILPSFARGRNDSGYSQWIIQIGLGRDAKNIVVFHARRVGRSREGFEDCRKVRSLLRPDDSQSAPVASDWRFQGAFAHCPTIWRQHRSYLLDSCSYNWPTDLTMRFGLVRFELAGLE